MGSNPKPLVPEDLRDTEPCTVPENDRVEARGDDRDTEA
jgi:hypothetical protein